MYYFAYGSNLHPYRLMQRISQVELIGVTRLYGYKLQFHKKSRDGSAKCNILATDSRADVVMGAVYILNPEQKQKLDEFEGLGAGYTDNRLSVPYQEKQYHCFTYAAQATHIVFDRRPYHWYKSLVVLGARHLGFPVEYIKAIETVPSIHDPDTRRNKENQDLIEEIIDGDRF